MKKFLTYLLLMLMVFIPTNAFAVGGISVSPASLTIEEGSSQTFTITAVNTIGDVSISSSNSGVASVSAGEWGTGMVEAGQTKSGTVTVTGNSAGSATIVLSINGATFDEEDLSGQTRTINVNVVAKPTPPPTPDPTPTPTPTPDTGNTDNKPNNQPDEKSKNNKLKELLVEGYEIVKIDDNNYTLAVSNDVTSINVKATAEDSKAKVAGDGKRDINVGENNIEVVVTSESGEENKYIIKVTRRDGYYLEDLDSILKDDNVNDISIVINADTKISSQDLEKIKNSGKTVKFNYYNNEKKLIYCWIIDGSKLNNISDLLTTISYESEHKAEILELSNNADGLFVSLKQLENLPEGVKIKIFVGSKFDDGSFVDILALFKSSDKLENVKKSVKVKDGYIEFDVVDSSDYFITLSATDGAKQLIVPNKSSSSNMPLFVATFIFVFIALIFLFILKRKKKNQNDALENTTEISIDDDAQTSANSSDDNVFVDPASVQSIGNLNVNDVTTAENSNVFNSVNTETLNVNNSVTDQVDVLNLGEQPTASDVYGSQSSESLNVNGSQVFNNSQPMQNGNVAVNPGVNQTAQNSSTVNSNSNLF